MEGPSRRSGSTRGARTRVISVTDAEAATRAQRARSGARSPLPPDAVERAAVELAEGLALDGGAGGDLHRRLALEALVDHAVEVRVLVLERHRAALVGLHHVDLVIAVG